MIRSYSELRSIPSFDERFRYLKLSGVVGNPTFGSERYINQQFYTSSMWKRTRHWVIARDLGCDLGVEGLEVYSNIHIHHMNPMRVEDILHGDESILDPEFLISTSHRTHNAIHYGDEKLLPRQFVERRPGDTKLW